MMYRIFLKILLIIGITLFSNYCCYAQGGFHYGPSDVVVGHEEFYAAGSGDQVYWYIYPSYLGTIDQQENPATAKITWNQVGSGRIEVNYYINGQYYNARLDVTVHPALSGGTIALDASSTVYNSTAPVVRSVTGASGGLGLTGFSYQWQRSYDNVHWEDVPTVSSAFYRDYEQIKKNVYYRREVYSYDVAYSNTVVLNVIPELNGGQISSSQVIAPGASPAQLTSLENASGGSGSYSYSWEYSNNKLDWNTTAGSGTTFQPGTLTKTRWYRRKVISGTQIRYSNPIQILVKNTVTTNTPDATSVTPSEPPKSLYSYSGIIQNNLNSITVSNIYKSGVKDNAALLALTQPKDIRTVTSYQDGIGRTIQTVAAKATLNQKDVIGINQYDEFGREMVQFLPYVANSGTSGAFRTDVSTAQPAFYDALYSGSNTDEYFYSTTATEDAPISRIVKSTIPGKSFSGSGIGSSVETRTNYGYENIRIWTIGNDIGDLPKSSGIYEKGKLTVSTYTDAEQHSVTTYTDLEGKTILKVVQVAEAANAGAGLRTYYVYDEMRHLRYIIPPLAEKYCAANNSWSSLSQSIADHLCYRFFYDDRGRVISRKIPGKQGASEYVYDMRDRPVFMQDPLLKDQDKWMVYFYDGLDRPIMTATYQNTSATRGSLQNQVDQASPSYVTISYNEPPPEDLSVAERVPGTARYIARKSITFNPGFTTEDNANFATEIDPNAQGTIQSIQVKNPIPGITGYEPIAITFYDNYDWQGAASFSNNFTIDAGSNPYPQPVDADLLATGRVTGTKTKIVGSDQWLTSTYFYDHKGRMIQSQNENIAGAVDMTTSQYDFSGKLLSTYLWHRNPQSPLTSSIKILLRYQYDATGRTVEGIYQTILSAANPVEKQISAYTYDPLGRLQTVTLSPSGGAGGGLETLHYTYNLQGQLTGINPDYADNKLGGNYFGEKLFYDRGFRKTSLDGNLAGMTWRRKGHPDAKHAYGYTYDPAGRLRQSDYSRFSGSVWDNAEADYGVTISGYDENGNIQHLKREGMLPGNTKATIDDLQYQYGNNAFSNLLLNVADNSGNNKVGDFIDGNKTVGGINDYVYDKNGNLIHDRNRGISISYDPILDKPLKISLDSDPDQKYIQYTYSYGGTLLQKKVKNKSKLEVYTYINGFTYKNDTLQYFMQPEGRVRYTKEQDANGNYTGNYTFVYDYFISDHLGNVRTVLTEQQLVNKYPAATLEDNRVATEKNYYTIADGRIVAKTLTGATQSSFENKLYRTNAGNNEKAGPGITLKVMAGDKVYIKAESFYQQPGGSGVGSPIPLALSALANALIGTPVVAAGKSVTTGTITANPVNATELTQFLQNDRTPANTQTPRAYLNWVLFDENFQFVDGGVDPVNPSGGYKLHTEFVTHPVQVTKNGYLFVYCSNESDINVFFDNLQLTHIQGHLQQEDTYYPFGLGIMAMSSKAANGLQNGFKYNGIAEEDNFDLDLYAAYYRTLDPQLGRWWQIYPMAPSFPGISGYNSMFDNPVNLSDPLGNCPTCPANAPEGSVYNYLGNLFRQIGGQWIGSGPETVITASRMTFGDFMGQVIVDDLGKFAIKAAIQMRANYELRQLQRPTLDMPGWSPSSAPTGVIRPYQPDMMDQWSESDNGFAQATYSMVDNVWVNVQSILLQPFKQHIQHLNGTVANKSERVNAFVGTTSDVVVSIVGGKAAKVAGGAIFGRVSKITTTDGFLFRGFSIRTPVNIPVQRFGTMSLNRADFWGLKIGSNRFLNRTFYGIKPVWNPLTDYTTGIIPKGTTIRFGIVGPQGLKYPGGGLQFIVGSRKVINQSFKFMPR